MSHQSEVLSPEDQELIDQIKRKVESGLITTMQDQYGMKARLYPPASDEEIAWAENGIGAPLPPLIRELYRQVGNGGFGPGYGIAGLRGGKQIYKRDFVENVQNSAIEIKAHLRESIAQADSETPDYQIEQDKRHYENWNKIGIDHLIWYCDWGCNIVTLVDYNKPECSLYSADGLDIETEPAQNLRQWWKEWVTP